MIKITKRGRFPIFGEASVTVTGGIVKIFKGVVKTTIGGGGEEDMYYTMITK